MNLNAFFKKLWQSRAEAEAQEQKIREQEEQDRKDADAKKAREEEAERRAAAAEAAEIEDAGHSASEVADGESYRATYLREIDDESRARMRYEREQEAAGVVLGNELEDQYVEQATREWIGEGEQAPAQEVTGLEQPVPEPSQNPVPAPAPSQAADLDDELEME